MFSANTEELAQNKLILLYIIENSPHFFDTNRLTEYILEKDYLNYFLIKQYLSELLEGSFIKLLEEDEIERYAILEKGSLALEYFDSKIPQTIKDESETDFKVFSYKKEKETEVTAEYFLKENGEYMVNLKLVENEESLFSIYISAPSAKAAENICDRWKNDTENLYKNIIELFM